MAVSYDRLGKPLADKKIRSAVRFIVTLQCRSAYIEDPG